MKTLSTLTLIPILFFLGIESTSAQQFKSTTYTEVTQVSPKAGVKFGSVLPLDYGKMEIGAFYQKSVLNQFGEKPVKNYEQEFYGMFTSFYLMEKESLDLKLNIRTGSVNGKYFTITPALLSEIKLGNTINVEAGAGMRNMQPTLIMGLTIQL